MGWGEGDQFSRYPGAVILGPGSNFRGVCVCVGRGGEQLVRGGPGAVFRGQFSGGSRRGEGVVDGAHFSGTQFS